MKKKLVSLFLLFRPYGLSASSILALAIIGTPILSQEPPKANFAVCDEIKRLDPQASEEVYAAFVKKMQKSGVDSCACGMYLLDKKFDKAHKQMASEYQLSKNDVAQIKAAELDYANRSSASKVHVIMNSAVDDELRYHILHTIQAFQRIREERYPYFTSNVTTKKSETLHIRVKWPEYTVEKNLFGESSSISEGGINNNSHVMEPVNKIMLNRGRLNRSNSIEELKGLFNHEFIHYYFDDFDVCNFLSLKIFNKNIRELVLLKNSIQKYFFAQEYRADWFVGLMSRNSSNFEHVKQELQPTNDDTSPQAARHPPIRKRLNWVSRWINLKRAENKA